MNKLYQLFVIAAAVVSSGICTARSGAAEAVVKNEVKRVERPPIVLPASIGHIRGKFTERNILASDAHVGMRLGAMLANSASLMFGTVKFNGVTFFYHTNVKWP